MKHRHFKAFRSGLTAVGTVFFLVLRAAESGAQSLPVDHEILSTRKIILDEIQKLIPKYQVKVGVMGSSVRGNKYLDPMIKSFPNPSDVDMTLIVDAAADSQTAFQKWTDFYSDLKSNVETRLRAPSMKSALQNHFGAEFADDYVRRVLDSVNVYPPDQLVSGAATPETYQQELKNLFQTYGSGQTPHRINLGNDPFDAVVGEGALPFRQAYEATHGVVFEETGGKVSRYFHDLQEVTKFTGGGAANLSRQFLVKCRDYLDPSHAKDLGKNLKRLNQFLKKSKSMAGLNAASRVNPELDDLIRKLDGLVQGRVKMLGPAKALESGSTEWLRNNADDIQRALLKADVESRVCQALFESADDAQRAILKTMIESSRWQQFTQSLGRYYRGMTGGVSPGTLVKSFYALAFAMEYLNIRAVYAEQGGEEAWRQFQQDVVGIVNLPYGLTRMAFLALMEDVKSGAYGVAVSRQGCEDFLAGIISVMGGEKIQQGFEIEELARLYIHEDKVVEVIDLLATQAVTRSDVENPNAALTEAEAGKKAALMKKCGEPLLKQWLAKRVEWFRRAAGTAIDIREEIEPILLSIEVVADETDAAGKRRLTCRIGARGDRQALYAGLQTLREQIRDLGGRERIGELVVEENYRWSLDGKPLAAGDGGGASSRLLTLLDLERDGFLGHGIEQVVTVDANVSGDLELDYQLEFQSKLSPAPEVMGNLDSLAGVAEKKALAFLEPPVSKLEIVGSAEAMAGEEAGFFARLAADQLPEDGVTLKWWTGEAGTRKEMGTGRSLSVSFPEAGRYLLHVEATGPDGANLARADHEIMIADPAGVTFRVFDGATGKPVENAEIRLHALFKSGGDYTVEAKAGVGTVTLLPGPYQYEANADGYDSIVGNSVLTFDETVDWSLDKVPDAPPPQPLEGNTATLGPGVKLLKLTLSHDELIIEPGKQGYIQAGGLAMNGPSVTPVDIADAVRWESSDPKLVTVNGGVVESVGGVGDVVITASVQPGGNSAALASDCRVTVRERSKQMVPLDFSIHPDQERYAPGARVRFVQEVQAPTEDDLEFTWYIDGKILDGPETDYQFDDIGKYVVRMEARSKSSGHYDSSARTIEVNEAPESVLTIGMDPQPPIPAPAAMTFTAEGENLPDDARLTWFVDGAVAMPEEPARLAVTLAEGEHKISLFASADDWEEVAHQTVEIGGMESAGSGQPLGRWINRFSVGPTSPGGEAEVMSEYWIGGDGKWSGPVRDRTVKVEGSALLETGEQDAGYNTGWLLYVPKGTNELRYQVLGFDFERRRSRLVYEGKAPLHNCVVDPTSIEFIEVASRAADVKWRSKKGDLGKVRIYKSPASGFVKGGLEELEFIEVSGGSEMESDSDFTELTSAISHSAPPGERVYVRIGEDAGPVHICILIKTGDEDEFGHVDEQGRYHHHRGDFSDIPGIKPWGDLKFMRKYLVTPNDLGAGLHKMPVVPRAEIEGAFGKTMPTMTIEYTFFLSPDAKVKNSSGAYVTLGVNGYGDSTLYQTFANSGISNDGIRLPLESVKDGSEATGGNSSDGPAGSQGLQIIEMNWRGLSWTARLQDGVLDYRMAGVLSDIWARAADHVKSVSGAGTGVGPCLAFQASETTWRVVLIQSRTGKVLRQFSRAAPITVERGGEYGAYLKIGEDYFTIEATHNQLREYDPQTKQYK